MRYEHFSVLMLEDDHDDRWLTQNMVEELGLPVQLRFLSNTTELENACIKEVPQLILLDFNTHPLNGLEVLKQLKCSAAYKHIPVVVLGDSTDTQLIQSCYAEGANGYAIKPSSFAATKAKIQLFFSYWLEVVETPTTISEEV